MIVLDAKVVGDAATIQRLEEYPRILRMRLRQAIDGSARQYQQQVQSVELSGAVLRTRTGKLRSSVVIRYRESPEAMSAAIWPKAKYGWMWGFGTPKNEVLVKPFVRKTLEGTTFSLKKSKRAKKGQQFSQGVRFVRGHRRRMIGARVARPFMGPAYERMRTVIEARLKAAVEQARTDAFPGSDAGAVGGA